MEINEAISTRKSIRAFKPDPVPQKTLREILQQAQKAPSWTNIQPWEFAIATGHPLQEIRQTYLEMIGKELTPDLPRPLEFPEPYDTRRRIAIGQSQEAQGIRREDKEGRLAWERAQLTNFGSPCEIYLYTDRSLFFQGGGTNVWAVFDCASVAENIMLLATSYGLGTIPQAQAVVHPEVLRRVLKIPESKLMILGIAIGFPNWNSPLNKMRTAREPLDGIAQWHGFPPE